jgi:hypothetical protein
VANIVDRFQSIISQGIDDNPFNQDSQDDPFGQDDQDQE